MTKKKLSPWNNNLEFIQSLKPETNFHSDNLPKEPNYLKLRTGQHSQAKMDIKIYHLIIRRH